MKDNAMAARALRGRFVPAVIAIASAALMTGCGTTGDGEHKSLIPLPWKHKVATRHGDIDPKLPKLPKAGSGRGGYYQDDGPGDNPPPGLQDLPDALVKYEPYAKFANRPYSVFGQTYTPLLNDEPFSQRGVASWYGVKFHGQRTSSGEAYDMYKMTAAHPTLPIPSYARITSLETGKSVVVRINDRGPFHSDRIVDVSYTAALKLGLLGKGSHQVEVERLFPDDPTRIATVRRAATSAAQTAPAPSEIAALMLEDRVAMDSAAVARPDAAAKPAAVKSGFYLQLGAYGREGKAEEIGEMLKKSGVAQALEVVRSGAVNRLYSGPFETRAMAQEAMRALPSSLGLKPIVVRR
nr:septal ring lytic transglycosylase RlpA family protein [Massilia norwichensis]